MEKEFAARPLLANMLGIDIFSIPSPNRPLGAAPVRNAPVCLIPHLERKKYKTNIMVDEEMHQTVRITQLFTNFDIWKPVIETIIRVVKRSSKDALTRV